MHRPFRCFKCCASQLSQAEHQCHTHGPHTSAHTDFCRHIHGPHNGVHTEIPCPIHKPHIRLCTTTVQTCGPTLCRTPLLLCPVMFPLFCSAGVHRSPQQSPSDQHEPDWGSTDSSCDLYWCALHGVGSASGVWRLICCHARRVHRECLLCQGSFCAIVWTRTMLTPLGNHKASLCGGQGWRGGGAQFCKLRSEVVHPNRQYLWQPHAYQCDRCGSHKVLCARMNEVSHCTDCEE